MTRTSHAARGPRVSGVGLGVLAVAVGLSALAMPVAAEVRFPLTIDYEILRIAVRRHLQEQRGGGLELWRTPDGCGTFVLRELTVEPAEGRLRISGPASASAGLYLFGFCWASVSWDGHAEITARPEIGRDWQLRLGDLDMQLYDSARRRSETVTRVWSVVKSWAEAGLSSFSYDVGPPVEEMKAVLTTFAGPAGGGSPLVTALQALRPVGMAVESDGLKVVMAIDLPPAAATPRAPEPALTPAQLRRWEAALEGWDGFVGFVIKDLGAANVDGGARDELFDVLLTARRDVLAVLGRGPESGVDPVRGLFLTTWERLRTIVRRTAVTQKGDPSRALRYVAFLAAGDALAAIQAAAPSAGLDISADGLRRLARALDPTFTRDPVEYSEQPDPRLQQLFRFRDPDGPPRRPRRKPSGWHWLRPRLAHAAEVDEWQALGARLDRWVPTGSELSAYRETVDRLLTVAAERSIDPDLLEERFDDLFRALVKAVAWQESCWRQFVRQGDRATYLVSSSGDVGMMQINVRIWRGFFSPDKLRWSARYNVGAGAEILQHLLIRYGVREARERLDNAARSTYSAYHGGPARYQRYRLAGVPAAIQAIDRAFWEKYRLLATGEAGDRVLCLAPRRTAS